MGNIKQVIIRHETLRVPYKAVRTVLLLIIAILFLWIPYVLKSPRRLKFFPQWLIALRPGATPFGDRMPLISFEAKEWLEGYLTNRSKVFEYGSGGSSLFIAKRAGQFISAEHNKKWYELLTRLLKEAGFNNYEYFLREPEFIGKELAANDDYFNYTSSPSIYSGYSFKSFCEVIDKYPDGFFDLVFIDGVARPSCIFHSINKVKPGGFLMLDDSERREYDPAIKLLDGWQQKVFKGPKSYAIGRAYQTTIWQKPVSSFDI